MQRVSIGRAIVRDPRLFLMDEPLSNLDAKLRETLRVELEHIQKTQGSTTLFVTHDQVEALTMADRIGVLLEGKLEQIGDPIEIYDRPASVSVAQLVGSPRINLLPADIENGAMHVRNSSLNLALVEKDGDLPQSFSLGVRPEDIVLDPEGEFVGEVALVEPLGVETVIHITVGEQSITSLVSGLGKAAIGDNIRFNVMRKRLHFFDPEGHRV
jgi:multiple sugar transport system ATP-binding protein